MPVPIELTLYDKNDQPIKTYSRNVIPWGLLKKAVRLTDSFLGDENQSRKKQWFSQIIFWKQEETRRPEEQQMEAISQFVVDLFGNQFTVKELESGADFGEIMTIFQSVIARANNTVRLNPTPRPSSKKPQGS